MNVEPSGSPALRVRITKKDKHNAWYNKHVGEMFYVVPSTLHGEGHEYVTQHEGETSYIGAEDCVVIGDCLRPNKYSREIKPGVFVDVYDVLRAFNVTDPCLQHLLKKALAGGQRGHKDLGEDLSDILASAKRAVEMHKEWEAAEA